MSKREAEISNLTGVVSKREAEIKYFSYVINEIKLSRSWKITKPIRNLATLFRRIESKSNSYVNNLKLSLKLIKTLNFHLLYLKIKRKYFISRKLDQYQIIDDLFCPKKREISYQKSIDIIIPIFNGLQFLKPLFNSIKKNTNIPYRLIVIDDKSTDERVSQYLKKLAKLHGNFLLLQNEENIGFIKSVNNAVNLIESDIFVLLNSDVEVPMNWLQRLINPFTLESNLASTTPFSNSATIASFPNFLEDNELYKKLSLNQIDKIFSLLSPLVPSLKIPTGVGFCMAIRKEVINEIGFFDEIYGRGYAEENDWCMRASKNGYQHAIVNNLFVYHKHGGSFLSEEKNNLIKNNLSILHHKYPFYDELVHQFISKDPPKFIRIIAEFAIRSKYLNINTYFVVDHDVGGGTNSYRRELIQKLLDENHQVILFTENKNNDTSLVTFCIEKELQIFEILDIKILRKIFKLILVDTVIYNNAVNYRKPLSMINEVINLKKYYKFKLVTLFHDFFPICPSYTLIDSFGQYCGVPEDKAVCIKCISKLKPSFSGIINENNNINVWRDMWNSFLQKSDEIISFSDSSKEIILKAYPSLANKILVIPHKVFWKPNKKPIIKKGHLHIGVIGGINYAKGADVLVKLCEYIQEKNLNIKTTLIGEIDLNYYHPNLSILGRYNQADLPRLVEESGINMILMPSIWPETFSYVMSEIIKMQLPVLSLNIGAQGEKVKNYKLGRALKSCDAEHLVNEALEFHNQQI